MRFARIVVAASAVGIGIVGHASTALSCTADTECKGGRICMNGACVAPSQAAPTPARSAPRAAPVVAPPPAPPPGPSCPAGQAVTPDTSGHCCWADQVWTNGRCVGVPTSCPTDMVVNTTNQTCEPVPCTRGQERTTDGIHCCWPAQGWSTVRKACVGVPQCPSDLEVEGATTCVSKDKDGDGIPNAVDKCPDQPEDFNGYKDDDGCPDEPERLAMVEAEQKAAAAKVAAAKRAEAKRRQEAIDRERREKEELEAAAAEREKRDGRRTAGWVVGGIGLGLGAASFVFMGLGNGENSSIQKGGFSNSAAISGAASSGHTDNLLAYGFGIGGIAAVVVGGSLVLFDLPTSDPEHKDQGDKVSLRVSPLPGGLALSGSF